MLYVRSETGKWHRVVFGPEHNRTEHVSRCGKSFPRTSETTEGVPLGADTCESCLRLLVRDEENG